MLARILFLLPFGLWLYSFRTFFAEHIKLIVDAHICFIYTNYYLNNMARGVYPLWNPFNVWGRPDDFNVRMIGEFNPTLYLTGLLHQAGLSFALSYYIYLVSYYFLGMIGFYLLALRLIKDKQCAFAAMLLLMFSNLSSYLFNDLLVILVLIPAIWFYYFLVAFSQTPSRTFFIGLIFAAMVIVTTYLPFLFLTTLLGFLILFLLVYIKDLPNILNRYLQFAKQNPWLVTFGILCFALSLLPGYWWQQAAGAGDYVVGWRHAGTEPLGLTIDVINHSGLVGANTLNGLVGHLDKINLNHFFIPVFAFVIALLGMIVPISRKLILLLALSCFTIFVSLGSVTPLHRFLYEHIFFFKYFRNLHFLLWFFLPILILFLGEQLRLFLDQKPRSAKGSLGLLIYISVVHLAFLILCLWTPVVIPSTFIVLGLSFLFFCLYFTKGAENKIPPARKSLLILLLLSVIVMIQPLEVFSHIRYHTRGTTFPYSLDPYSLSESRPHFSFVRPRKGEVPAKTTKGFGDVSDTSGFETRPYYGLKWSYFLHENIDAKILSAYVRHKFVAYEATTLLTNEEQNMAAIEQELAANNVAFVNEVEGVDHSEGRARQAEFITAAAASLEVLHFDINAITFKTNFDRKKFLVYNDSFHNDWQATVNGVPHKLYRANVAFKGLWLEPGEKVVTLRFRSLVLYYFHWGLLLLFTALFAYLVYAVLQRRLKRS